MEVKYLWDYLVILCNLFYFNKYYLWCGKTNISNEPLFFFENMHSILMTYAFIKKG